MASKCFIAAVIFAFSLGRRFEGSWLDFVSRTKYKCSIPSSTLMIAQSGL